MPPIFQEAINTMTTHEYREPQSFLEYVTQNNITANNTANYISIQTYEQLAPELKENQLMVFRLGANKQTKGTSFALMKTDNDFHDFFLFDEVIFQDIDPITLELDWNDEKYISFSTIAKLTETSFVNLALASKVLEKALSLDTNTISIPATGRGNYTFQVKPKEQKDIIWKHTTGQVEIDSIFVGNKNGEKHLFIVEAKSGKFPSSLAKHKLMYPIYAIIPNVPKDYKITPVYMNVKETQEFITFYIAECNYFRTTQKLSIDSIEVKNASIIQIKK